VPNIIVNDILPRIQYSASASQTVFTFPFLMFFPTDINVYKRLPNAKPDDLVDILTYNIDYTVSINPPPLVGGTITLLVPAAANDIITLVRNQPDQRLNFYIQGGPFTSSMVNFDFDQIILMDQQRQMYDEAVGVHYNLNAIIQPNVDNYLPVLPPSSVWLKNADNTEIIFATLPEFPVGSLGGEFTDSNRLVRTDISTGENDIAQTNLQILSDVISSVAGAWGLSSSTDLNFNAPNLNLNGQKFPTAGGAIGTVLSIIAPNVLGYVNVATTPFPTTINTIPKFITATGSIADSLFSESGTDLLLPADPIQALAAATKQYVDAASTAVLLPTIYVSSTGSDSTGDGTIVNPFATYEHARQFVLPTASALSPNTIGMIGVFNIVGDLILSPFINISGIGTGVSIVNVSGQVLLDASFGTTTEPITHVQNIVLNAAGNINLVFPAFQQSTLHFDNVDFKDTAQFNATGSGTNIACELVLIENCISIVTQPAFTFTNIRGAIVNSNVTNTASINNSAVTQNFFILTAPIANMGNCLVQTTSTGTMLAVLQGCFNPGSTVTIDGTGVQFLMDSASYGILPTFLNGASFSQVTLVSLSDGVEANTNFTPVNYTPVGTSAYKADSVTGNLKGIDNALAIVAPSTSAVIKSINQTAHGFTVQQLIYLNGSVYTLVLANSVITAEAIGIVTSVIDANNFIITTSGYCNGFSGLTAGTVMWASDVTPGLLTATMPTAIGSIEKPVFVADSTTSGYFINYRGNVITTPSLGRLLNVQRFLTGTAATYTPTAGTNTAYIRMLGGGGGGGTATSSGGTQISVGGGGGAGGYLEHLLLGITGTYLYTIGGGGTSGAAGTATTFSGGALSAAGGNPGANGVGSTTVAIALGGSGAGATGGSITNQPGGPGTLGVANYPNGVYAAGFGGNSALGGGAPIGAANPSVGASATANSGAGGSGAQTYGNAGTFAGGAGGSGILIIEEYS
jgi:hypothetical protein